MEGTFEARMAEACTAELAPGKSLSGVTKLSKGGNDGNFGTGGNALLAYCFVFPVFVKLKLVLVCMGSFHCEVSC